MSIVCIGGATLDRTYLAKAKLRPSTSNPVAAARLGFGGVARNVAETLARLEVPTSFVSLVGDDENGRLLLQHLCDCGVDVAAVTMRPGQPTSEYVAAMEPNGELAFGLADMSILDGFGLADLDRAAPCLATATWVFADCNLPEEILYELLKRRRDARFQLAIDAVSTPKVERLPAELSGLDLLFVNHDEANAYLAATDRPPGVTAVESLTALLAAGAHRAILTLGEKGVLLADGDRVEAIAAVPANAVDVTGAGDALIGATLAALVAGKPLKDAIRQGALLAALTVEAKGSVHPNLSPTILEANRHRSAEMVR